EQLLPLVYDELRKLARAKLRHEQPGHTLEATALVHEAYLRLVKPVASSQEPVASQKEATGNWPRATGHWHSRGHFFAAAAEAMRRILVESARRKQRLKRGGDREREPLDEIAITSPELSHDLLELDEALERLAIKHPRKA